MSVYRKSCSDETVRKKEQGVESKRFKGVMEGRGGRAMTAEELGNLMEEVGFVRSTSGRYLKNDARKWKSCGDL